MDQSPLSRRALLATATAALPLVNLANQDQTQPPPLPDPLVKDFVGAAHSDLDKLKALHAETPTLLNAVWDWRNGDFESAMGAAAHMGRRDIALYLIENGARTDLFVHAMLGDLPVVKATIDKYPAMVDCKGAHGITLIRHAEKGGELAKEVLDYLKTIKKLAR